MAPRPRQTNPPSPPITLPPRGSGKSGGTTPVVPVPVTPTTLPRRGSGIGQPAPTPTETYIQNLQNMPQEELIAKFPLIEEDISESQRKAQRAETEYQLRLTDAQRAQQQFANEARRLGVSEERINAILAGEQDPESGFRKFFTEDALLGKGVRKAAGVIKKAADVVGDIPIPTPQNLIQAGLETIIGGKPSAAPTLGDVGRGIKAVAMPPLKAFGTVSRYWVATLDEVFDEIDVLRGAKKRGEQLYYPLPPELREKIGPGGIFRGGPEGIESVAYPRTPAGTAGFQWSELLETARNPETGIGNTLWRDVTGNAYVDQSVGFLGEIFGDPTNLFTFGAGGIASKSAAKIAGISPEAYRTLSAASKAVRDQGKLAIAREVALEQLARAEAAADAARVAAAQKEVTKITKQLDKVSRAVAGDAAPRVSGRTGAEALGTELQRVRDNAQAIVDRAEGTLDAPFGVVSPEQAAVARYTLEIITPQVISGATSKGFASLIPSIGDALKRTTGPAASALGVRGGVSIRNPLEVFGGPGRARYTLPGSELITNPFGKLVSESIGGIRGGVSREILEFVTPTGEGGLYPGGVADMRVMLRTGQISKARETALVTKRREIVELLKKEDVSPTVKLQLQQELRDVVAKLRSKKLTPEEISEINKLLNLNRRFSGRRVLEGKNALATAARFGLTNKTLQVTKNELRLAMRYVTNPEEYARAVAAGDVKEGVQKAYNAWKGLFDEYYRQAQAASSRTGFAPMYRSDYVPQFLSEETVRKLRRSKALNDELKEAFGYDRTWFTGNFRQRTLNEGDEFFGTVLTAEDMKGGVTRLNEIANAGGFKGKFFEDDPLTIASKYARRHSDFLALQKVLGEAPDVAPSAFARAPAFAYSPLKSFDPRDVDKYAEVFGLASRSLTKDPEKLDLLDNLSEQLGFVLQDISRRASGALPYAGMGLDEVTALNEANKAIMEFTIVANTIITNKAESAFDLTAKSFTDVDKILKEGWQELEGRAPGIMVNPEVQRLFMGVDELKDFTRRQAFANLYKDMITFAKAWFVARPGFPNRNLQSNLYMMTFAAGAETGNLAQGLQIFKAMQKGVKSGKSVEEVAKDVVKRGLADSEEQVLNTIAYYGSAGFGRFGEVAREIGDATGKGITQLGPARGLGDPVTRAISRAIGIYPQKLRAGSEYLEEMTRFQLMWDGIKRGLGPEQAAARVSRYLIDYQDLSKLDQMGKQVFPFWMWMTRNTPLQLQLQFTSPRGPLLLEKFRNATEDEEATQKLKLADRQKGVFQSKKGEGFAQLGGGKVPFALPAFGFGEENQLRKLYEDPESFIGNLIPLYKTIYEVSQDKRVYDDRPITEFGDVGDRAFWRKAEYAVREVFGVPLSTFRSWVATIPFLRKQKAIQYIFEIGINEAAPWEEAVGAAARLFGIPAQPGATTLEKAREEERIKRELDKIVEEAREAKTKKKSDELEKRRQEAQKRLDELGITP